ncbi:hypothetical protein NDU88_003183 [Pleurodeles waltl]|uniref:Uncharacterized protein n=1 Tax=Pleurodeles waltl TaxID=8319 RepID=A0AAV7W2S0_PLEWA|nr:hypothetical protein NDU88_003183 [Pleurodeles waltl]
MGGVHSTLRRTSRRRRATRNARVIVHSDGTLSMDRRRREREEARRLVQSVTAEREVSPVVAYTNYLQRSTVDFGYSVCVV